MLGQLWAITDRLHTWKIFSKDRFLGVEFVFKGKEAFAPCCQIALHEGWPVYTPVRVRRGLPLHVRVCASLTGPHFETGCYCVTSAVPVHGTFQVPKKAFLIW